MAAGIPIIYECELEVCDADIDGLGHVNNVVYLQWVQVAATAHWNHAATQDQKDQIAWVALRHEIDYLKPAYLGEKIILRTYVGEVSGVRFERFVEVLKYTEKGEQPIARSRSLWAAIDVITMRPKRVPASLNNQFMRFE